MKYYKVERFPKLQIVDDKDASQVPSDWIDVTDEVRHKPGQKPNVKFDKPKKPKKKEKKEEK
tara:strand:- start:331 stop:516 length:186 start_codon:yes stop_codon:yes gene_type:complete